MKLFDCKTNMDFYQYLKETKGITWMKLAELLGDSRQAWTQKFKKDELREKDITLITQKLELTDDELLIFIFCN